MYDAEIRTMDHPIGFLFQHLREPGSYQRSWIIMTSDHGDIDSEQVPC